MSSEGDTSTVEYSLTMSSEGDTSTEEYSLTMSSEGDRSSLLLKVDMLCV